MIPIDALWHSQSQQDWCAALERYWGFVKPANRQLEREIEALKAHDVEAFDPSQWYAFLLNAYFPWKYTAANRLATTTGHLKKYKQADSLDELQHIKEELFACDKQDISLCLNSAIKIKGLGPAGASGLLAVLFPLYFGTADQFVVKALCDVREFAEKEELLKMKPEGLTVRNAALIIRLLRAKARELNEAAPVGLWTPRKIDMVLWTYGRNNPDRRGCS